VHDFRTARPARTVYCHQEFLDKLTARRTEPVDKRTALLESWSAVGCWFLSSSGVYLS